MNGDKKTTSTIHTERYNIWNGKLQSRQKIIINAIKENFNHNIHNKWIIAILVITMIFSVFIPLLIASFGGSNLMQDPDSTNEDDYGIFDIFETGISFPLSKTIQKNDTAVYNITVMNTGEKTDNIYLSFSDPENKADEGWYAEFININDNKSFYEKEFPLNPGELVTFQLIVIPPPELALGKGELIVSAFSKGASQVNFMEFEKFLIGAEIRVITFVGKVEFSTYKFNMEMENENITTKPKKQVESIIEIQNTGSIKDTYSLSVLGLPKDWDYFFDELDTPGENASVFLKPNEKRTFKVIFDVPKFPAKTNNITILATSNNNELITKGIDIKIEVTDIQKKDMTGETIGDLYGGIILWVLLLSTVVGSKAISNDLSQKSFTIYFARPIKKLDYVTIKYGSVASTLALITLFPILITYSGLVLLSNVGFEYFVDHLWVWGAIIISSLLITVVFTSVVLAFSSFTKHRFYGAIGLIVTYFSTLLMGEIIVNEFNNDIGSAISILHSLGIVGNKIFNVSDVASDYSWYFNLLSLMIITILATFAVILKISRTELSE